MNRSPLTGLAVLALGGLALAACGSTSTRSTSATTGHPAPSAAGASSPTSATTAQPAAGASSPTIGIRTTSLGTVLTTPNGRVIYLLTADRPGSRSCSGACLSYWPPVMLNGTPQAPAGLTAHLGELMVNGGQQLTVNGHPAYTYIGDSNGQINGEGIRSFGGTWWVLSPAGTAVTRTAPATTTPTTSRSYGGY